MSSPSEGSGAALGFRVIRYSGVQGVAMVVANVLQLATIGVIAGVLGPSDLGRFGLLFFLGALITMVFSLAAKPGTIRRTFGGGDDEDDDDEEEGKGVVSTSPKRSLGAGLLWSCVLGVAATALVVGFREPIGEALLGGEDSATLVLWAGMLGGAGVLYKVASISLWFERRPSSYLLVEVVRPALGLVATVIVLAAGGGLEGAVAAAAAGTLVAAVAAVALLAGSFQPNLVPGEVLAIVKAAGRRVPIVSSLWLMQNADVYLLSRFVDHADLGVYVFAAKLGLLASFLPQGFRVAMRPLRKTAGFKSVRSQYGRSVASGQLLGYFVLMAISSILATVMLAEVVIEIAPDSFADAGPLIPVAATGLVMVPLWRTINGQTAWPSKSRATFVLGTIGAALTFIGVTLLLAPTIGVYAAPVGMLAGLGLPVTYFFARTQLGPSPIDFPTAETVRALVVAAAIGGGYVLLPDFAPVLKALLALALLALYAVLLLALRVIPEAHWPALTQMAGAVFSGQSHRFNPRRGLRALDPDERARLRVAVTTRIAPAALAAPAISQHPPARGKAREIERTEGARLVRVLRGVGVAGGAAVMERSKWDGKIAEFLFADEPPAVRAASMRALLADDAEASDLRALEDLTEHLSNVPPDAWSGGPATESPVARRRRAAGRRGRNAVARAARAIARRI